MASSMTKFTHLDQKGQARMVDVGEKPITRREATASVRLRMRPATVRSLRQNTLRKGDAVAAARLAGIMAAKRTAELIPLCHPLPLEQVEVDFAFGPGEVRIVARVKLSARTGAEMEAMTAAGVAALTLYDMTKAVERGMVITDWRLEEKSGGRSGTWKRSSGRKRRRSRNG